MERKFVVKQAGRETLLYDPARDELHVLNPTAQLIRTLAREGRGIAEIEAAVRAHFHVPAGHELRGEIKSFLRLLQTKEL